MHGLTMLQYATSFACAEHPNIVLCKTFKILVALEAVSLQWSDHCKLTASKATKILNVLHRTMFGCPALAKDVAYQSIVFNKLKISPTQQLAWCLAFCVQKMKTKLFCIIVITEGGIKTVFNVVYFDYSIIQTNYHQILVTNKGKRH